ncbi:MAG TPA: Rossmann-like and DUF2520 domain-containing protein [Candidatus Sulfotelmatobacter sp.]|nr:Rossmann-like and DUF2520 domain-containing protein [Candidatus Sulfotelmatobacter sp.]
MRAKPGIAIVGPGRLGSALALSLHRAGFQIEAVVGRPQRRAKQKTPEWVKRVGAHTLPGLAGVKAEVVWFCVPDSEIGRVSRSLRETIAWKGRVALHSSGVLTSDELDALRRKGAAVASVHPLMTFVGKSRPPLARVPFAVEGDSAAVRVARRIVQALGGKPHPIRKADKAAYHAWGTFASPLLTALLATTQDVAKLAGVSAEAARRRMIPILSQTLANYAEFGAPRGFSGPIIRGDVETVKGHLRVLRKVPIAREVYIALAQAALQYLPAKNKGALRRLLEA